MDAQHFLNALFMIFIIRAGMQILADHARLYWTRHSTPGRDWFRFQKPVPADQPLWTAKQDSVSLPGQVGLPGLRHSIGLARWWHLGTDILWLLNGANLLRAAVLHRAVAADRAHLLGRVPQRGDGMIRYLSLHWPTESGWAAYNSLQLLAYFITVFVAAPLALITGLGMSPALSTRIKPVSRVLSIQVARSLHFLVLVWFLFFIVIHVTLVFTTGLLRNLNHIFAGRNDSSWIGFGIFCVPRHHDRRLGGCHPGHRAPPPGRAADRLRAGRAVQRLFEHVDATPANTARRTSPRISGTTAPSPPPRNTGAVR